MTACVCNSFVASNIIIATKKRQICDEHRLINDSWVNLFFSLRTKANFIVDLSKIKINRSYIIIYKIRADDYIYKKKYNIEYVSETK